HTHTIQAPQRTKQIHTAALHDATVPSRNLGTGWQRNIAILIAADQHDRLFERDRRSPLRGDQVGDHMRLPRPRFARVFIRSIISIGSLRWKRFPKYHPKTMKIPGSG